MTEWSWINPCSARTSSGRLRGHFQVRRVASFGAKGMPMVPVATTPRTAGLPLATVSARAPASEWPTSPIGPSPRWDIMARTWRTHMSKSKYGAAGLRPLCPKPTRSMATTSKRRASAGSTARQLPRLDAPGPEPCTSSSVGPLPPRR